MSGGGQREREHDLLTGDVLAPEQYADPGSRGGEDAGGDAPRQSRAESHAPAAAADEDWGKYGGDDGALEHEGAEAHPAAEAGSDRPDGHAGAEAVDRP